MMQHRLYKGMKIIFAIFFVIILLPALPARAQTESRRKIGLVLGGGGALGGAHLGVLKVLEENRIPVDYIAGTSMGSIVGGAYAAGMSPAEIEELLNSIDWANLFNDKPSRDQIPFRDKYDTRRLANFEVGIGKDGLKMPHGAVAGQKLDFILQEMTVRLGAVDDFDKLKIPYRAVATDIETGESVTLRKGNLAEAIRASMSVPGAFSPVEIDGRILVDGMVAKNLPVDVAKEMGAEEIICIDVGGALPGRDKLDSNIAVIMQMVSLFTKQNVDYQKGLLGDKDIFIGANPGAEFTAADFTRIKEIIDAGERIAREHIDELKRYSVSEEEYKAFLARQRGALKGVEIDFVKIGSTGRADPMLVGSKVKTKPGKEVDFKTLEDDLSRIYSIGDFENVKFSVVEEKGEKGLLIEGKEKSWGPHYLSFGANILENFRGDSYYTLIAQHQWRQVNRLGADWKNRFAMGKELGYKTLFYQPLDYSERFFLQPAARIGQQYTGIYSDHEKITEYKVEEIAGAFEGGMNFGNEAQARGGMFWRGLSAEPHIKRFGIPEFKDVYETGIHGNITYDSINSANFPRKGMLAFTDMYVPLEGLGSDEDYNKFEFRVSKPLSYKRHTLLAALSGGGKFGDTTIPYYNRFTLGGFPMLTGYKNNELRGQYFAMSNIIYYYQITNLGNVVANGLYVGGGLEAGNTWNRSRDIEIDDLHIGGAAFVGVDTIVGPLYIGYGYTEGGTDTGEFFAALGRAF